MGDLLRPLTIDTFVKKTSSKEIVDDFLAKEPKDWPSAEVIVEETGRTESSIYLSMKSYLERHPELGVGVQMNEGRVVLTRNPPTDTAGVVGSQV